MEKYLNIATVLKPQGIRGEVKVMPHTDTAEDICGFSQVVIGDTQYKVLACRAAGGFAYLTLRGVADRNAAELLRGKAVLADRTDAPALPEDRVYIADLIGCAVVTEEGEELGKVLDVTPARTDIYTISFGEREVMFAAAEGVIVNIDTRAGKVVVNAERFKQVATL